MQDSNQNDFISTVSHELRTPLTSIRGFSQTMLSSWDKLDDESKKKFVKIIEEQSQRLINLVENMLAVNKLQSEKESLIYSEFDIKPVINQVIMIIKNQYPAKSFQTEYHENLPNIFADKDKFIQVMTNLIENSAKYSLDNSEININAEFSNNQIIIFVINTGIGIDKTDYSKIFTKFSRIDNPLTRKVQGSGLGLYITKNLVEKMGGEIIVNSVPLNDTSGMSKITFTLKFPLKSIEEQTKIKCNR